MSHWQADKGSGPGPTPKYAAHAADAAAGESAPEVAPDDGAAIANTAAAAEPHASKVFFMLVLHPRPPHA
jgi:hypothetical protein